ncbi:hypothetical protein K2W90_00975 [Candidatus Babeliales bacterium]|nr:hypothetical protein [Candidatus Babeliales bacterium]
MNPLKKEVRFWVSLTVILFGISLYVNGSGRTNFVGRMLNWSSAPTK